VFVKWSHKLDAPGVNNIEWAAVDVSFADLNGAPHLAVRANHPSKHLTVDIPLKFEGNAEASS